MENMDMDIPPEGRDATEVLVTSPRFELVTYTWKITQHVIDTAEIEPLDLDSTDFLVGQSVGMLSKFGLKLKSSGDGNLSMDIKLKATHDLMPSVCVEAQLIYGIGDTALKAIDISLTEIVQDGVISLENFVSIEELKANKANYPAFDNVLKLALKLYEHPKTTFQKDPSGNIMALIHVGDFSCEVSKQSLSELSPKFAAMLSITTDNIVPKEITLDDFPSQYFPTLYSFLDKQEFPSGNSMGLNEVKALFQVATEYEIQGIFDNCFNVLIDLVNEHNFEVVEELTKQFGSNPTLQDAIETLKEQEAEEQEEIQEDEEFEDDEAYTSGSESDEVEDDQGIYYDDDNEDASE